MTNKEINLKLNVKTILTISLITLLISLTWNFVGFIFSFYQEETIQDYQEDFSDYLIDCKVYLIVNNSRTNIQVGHNTLINWVETMAWFDYVKEFGTDKGKSLDMECGIIRDLEDYPK